MNVQQIREIFKKEIDKSYDRHIEDVIPSAIRILSREYNDHEVNKAVNDYIKQLILSDYFFSKKVNEP